MTQRPQGRREFSLSIGGHILGVLLNFGAISLLTPLIQRGSKAMLAQAKPKGCPDVRLILDFQENQTQPFNFESRSIRSLVSLSSLNDCRCVETQAPNLNPS